MLKAHYDILGVSKSASKQQIITAYREKSLQHHPDKGGSTEMMGMLNEARDSVLLRLAKNIDLNNDNLDEDDDADVEENINRILAGKLFADLDDPEKRLSKTYESLHESLVKRYREEDNVENISAIEYFNRFETELYHDVVLDGENIIVIEHADLFALIHNRESSGQVCEELLEALQPLSPQIAIECFGKFIEGKYFGDALNGIQRLFKRHLTSVRDMAEYNLYSGIFEVLTFKEIIPGQESQLLLSLNKITDYIRAKTVNAAIPMPQHLASLLQNLYFRTLFAQALHLFWFEHGRNFNASDRADLADVASAKKYFHNLATQIIAQEQTGAIDEKLLRDTASLKKLYEFERFNLSDSNQLNSPDWSRQRGYENINWVSRLHTFASREILVNVLIKAGTYFQEASTCANQADLNVAKADQKLAFKAYMDAYAYARNSAPDLEIYTITNTLKFIAAFRYHDDDIKDRTKYLQTRLLTLVNIFPVYAGLQPNIDLLTHKNGSNLTVMRGLLHALVEMSKNKIPIDHEMVTVLYNAYEACIKNWYRQSYEPELESQFRLELMELLLKNNEWSFADLDFSLVSSIMIKRDNEGWLSMAHPLRLMNYGLQTYQSLDGVEVNTKTGEINFLLNDGSKELAKRNSRNTFTIYDLIEMLEKNITWANFSLDPIDPQTMYHPFNTMRFDPQDIYKTQFLNTMLLADYVLKFLTIGAEVQGVHPYDLRPIEEMIKHLPKRLKNIINNFHASQRHNSGSIHRFWIEAEQLSEAVVDDDNGLSRLAITDLKMVVKKHTMERDANGNLVDTQKDDEGWDLYMLTPKQKQDLDKGEKLIKGPAMIFVPEINKVFFIETDHIFKEDTLSTYHSKEIIKLVDFPREPNGKIVVTLDNSFYIYNLIDGIAAGSEVPSHFSPEYVFAQAFTEHYDEFSEHFLIFARLKELSKMTSAIRYLNDKQDEAARIKDFYSRLLRAIPDWEDGYNGQSTLSDFFAQLFSAKPNDYEEQSEFERKHAEIIQPLLAKNLYQKYLKDAAPIAEFIANNPSLTIDSPEIVELCNYEFLHEKVSVIRNSGRKVWESCEESIWKNVCDKNAELVRHKNAIRDKRVAEQLDVYFGQALKDFPSKSMNVLVNNAVYGDLSGFIGELAKRELNKRKGEIRDILIEKTSVLDGFKNIGLASEQRKDFKLENECLWVPASVRHHAAGNTCLFVYGGVRVLPRVNVISSTDPRHGQVMNNAFNGPSRVTVNSNNITTTNNAAQQRAAQASIERKAAEVRSQGYQEHHIASNKNKQTTGDAARIFAKAGMTLDQRANKIFLPNREGLHPDRSIHSGGHIRQVNRSLQEKLLQVEERGVKNNWNQDQYREAVSKIIHEERSKLRSGVRTLNSNKTGHARPQSPVNGI
jgi:hypothetical protein